MELGRLGLNAVIYGESKVGKSWMLSTMPAPRLILDAEGGSRFAPATDAERLPGAKIDPTNKIMWDPETEDPPAKGAWSTCIVTCRKYSVLDRVYEWLVSGKHPFESVGLDQLTEIQARMKDDIAGRNQFSERNWGELLRNMDDLIRKYRDLVLPDVKKPLQAVMFAAGSRLYDDGDRVRPLLEGQMRDRLPYFVDLIGYMHTKTDTLPDGTNVLLRRLLIQPVDKWVAGDRTHVITQHYGPVIVNPNATEMLAVLNGDTSKKEGK